MSSPLRWDVFCRVVDNYGDAAICWRLARELSHEHGFALRLWIDDVKRLTALIPAVADIAVQTVDGIEVRRWTKGGTGGDALPNVVVEAFGCGLPPEYVAAIGDARHRPVWIVLEYLSAEPWVQQHHGLPSPDPARGIERYFFFPGFTPGTGGLLRERGLVARRDAFDRSRCVALWSSLDYAAPPADSLVVSLFAYASAPLGELLTAWEQGSRVVVAAVPDGVAATAAVDHFRSAPARTIRRGALEVRLLPFLPQRCYDELLWCSDVNFVRGEDSFVRAQWAARPLVWQPYPQAGDAHHTKLDAFLELYCDDLAASAGVAVARMMRVWNQTRPHPVTTASAWEAFLGAHTVLRNHAEQWAARLENVGELAENLAWFAGDKLK